MSFKHLMLVLLIGWLVAMPAIAQGTIKAGDRVFVDSAKEMGTVIEVTPNGKIANVILDHYHTTDRNCAIMYDTFHLTVKPGAPPANGRPAAPVSVPNHGSSGP